MGAHKDHHTMRVTWHWRARARKAEDLLSEIRREAAPTVVNGRVEYAVPVDVIERITDHLEDR